MRWAQSSLAQLPEHQINRLVWLCEPRTQHQGCQSGLATSSARFAPKKGPPNGIILGLFKISSPSQNVLNLILKSPRLVPFGQSLTSLQNSVFRLITKRTGFLRCLLQLEPALRKKSDWKIQWTNGFKLRNFETYSDGIVAGLLDLILSYINLVHLGPNCQPVSVAQIWVSSL